MFLLTLALMYMGYYSGIKGVPIPETLLYANYYLSYVYWTVLWIVIVCDLFIFIGGFFRPRFMAWLIVYGPMNITKPLAGVLATKLLTRAGNSGMLSLTEFNQTQLYLAFGLLLFSHFIKIEAIKDEKGKSSGKAGD